MADVLDGLVDPYGEPVKQPRSRTGPGGPGAGPGGGFGGAFGGGGSGYFGASRGAPSGDFFGTSAMWPRRKLLSGPAGQIPVNYSPMVPGQVPRDTVPAMLTPGEGVLNTGAMAQPGMQNFLEAANQQGVKMMAMGGMVPDDGGEGMEAPVDDRRELIFKLLRLLLDDGPQEFAFGGMVRPQAGGFQRQPQMASRAPRMPQVGQTVGGSGPRPGAAPMGVAGLLGGSGMFGTPKTLGQPGGQQSGPVGLPGGGTTGPSTIGTLPGGFAAGNEYLGRGWDTNALLGSGYDLLRQFGGAGAFGPDGNPALLAALQSEAGGNADALRRRAATLADVSGLDPGQRASYAMQTDLNTQGDVANTLNAAKLGLLQNQQQFGQGLMSNLLGYNQQDELARLGYQHNRLQQNAAADQQGGWGQTLGGLGGAALGGWMGGGFRLPKKG